MSALDTIRSMSLGDFERLGIRIARELGLDIKGTKVEEGRVEMDAYMNLPTGQTLHYFVVFSIKSPNIAELESIIQSLNNPFIKILHMSTEEADEETVRYAEEKGIELAAWDELLQIMEKYGILRELEREPEKEAFLPSLGEVQSIERWARDFLDEGNTKKAMEYVEKGLDIKEGYGPLLKLKGDILLKKGRLREAEEAYRKAASTESADVDAWMSLSEVLEQEGRTGDALAVLEKVTEMKPRSYDAWMRRGRLLYMKGMYEEALLCFSKATEIFADGKEAWNNRGLCLKHLGRPEEAVESINRAIGIDSRFWDALLNKALLFHERGMFSEAITVYNYMLGIREDASILCQRGFAFEEAGKKEEAIRDFKRALAIDPTLESCSDELKALSSGTEEPETIPSKVDTEPVEQEEPEKKETASPLAALVSAVKEETKEAPEKKVKSIKEIFGDFAPEEGGEKEVDEPEEALEPPASEVTAEESHPEMEPEISPASGESESSGVSESEEETEEPAPVEEITEMFEETETPEEEQEASEIEEIPAPPPETTEEEKPEEKSEGMPSAMEGISSLSQLMTRGDLYFKMGMLEEALECYDMLKEAKPQSSEIWNRHGAILYLLERYGEAAESMEKALKLDEEKTDIKKNIIHAWAKSGRSPKALEMMNSILRVKSSPLLWVRRGKALESMGREGASVQSYQKALAAVPELIRVWNAMGISLHNIGEKEDSVEALENGISRDERDPVLWNNYGVVLHAMGRDDDAMEAFERALGEDIKYSPANNNIGVLLEKRGDVRGAEERFSMALENDGNAVYAYNNSKYL